MMWVECPVRGKFQMNVTDDLSLVQGVVCSDSIGGLPFFSWTPNRQRKALWCGLRMLADRGQHSFLRAWWSGGLSWGRPGSANLFEGVTGGVGKQGYQRVLIRGTGV